MITVARIRETVAQDFGVTPDRFYSKCREWDASHPRQVAMYLARRLTRFSLPALGRIFKRDHSTILHGIRSVEKRIAENRTLALKIEARELLLQCEGFQRIIDQIDDPTACKILIMRRWGRGEITPAQAETLIRSNALEAA